ncbi:MAG TPA: patatin-like phospholipase family protein [Bryobacteraceae bacterium]|nr:patatin-like phospholipase family protein [Bryobacteraceae bacterium]
MKIRGEIRGLLDRLVSGSGGRPRQQEPLKPPEPPRIGLALGGGFARGIAHVGVLRVLEQSQIPIHCITGVSAGSMVAAAFASGATSDEIAMIGSSMRFADIARWRIGRMGFAGSERMERFLRRLLKRYRFEEMSIPLGVVATDILTGEPVDFRGSGDVFLPIRASCSYPGLFQPVPSNGRLLVDGAMSIEIPAALARALGATHVVSVHLPMQNHAAMPRNMFQVVNRCFQILQSRTEDCWKQLSDVVISPDVCGVEWDAFRSAMLLVEAGERAALEALPQIRALVLPDVSGRRSLPAGASTALIPGSEPA